MVFVCTGTQIFQFDRLIKKLDELAAAGEISDKIFAQIGAAEYLPENYEYKRFIDKDEFAEYQRQADMIISHGGTGALIGASKLGKNIIAVPRLAKYKEHVDDHQLQVVHALEQKGYVRAVYDINNLGKTIKEAAEKPITKAYRRRSIIIEVVSDYIDKL